MTIEASSDAQVATPVKQEEISWLTFAAWIFSIVFVFAILSDFANRSPQSEELIGCNKNLFSAKQT